MKKYQPILVGFTALCIMAGMIGLLANCTNIIFAAVIQDLKFKAGDLSFYYTIKSIVSALTMTWTVKMVTSKYSNYVMAAFALLASFSYIAMSVFDALWQWYVSAAVCGMAAGCVFTAMPIILNRWFRKNNGMIIGLVMSGSGIAGAIFSPITSQIVQNFGWRRASIITGLITIVLVSLPSLFFLKAYPEEEGCSEKRKTTGGASIESKSSVDRNAAGQDNTEQTIADSAENSGSIQNAKSAENISKIPAWVFPLCVIAILFPSLEISFASHMTIFSMSIGYTLAIGGFMTSLAMVGNCSGKFILGLLADRIGIFQGMIVMLGVSIAGMLMFLASGKTVIFAYAAALCFGFIYSLYSTGPSLFMMEIYGKEHYAEKYSRAQAINTLIYSFGGTICGYVYDLTGSFTPVFLAFIAMSVTVMAVVVKMAAWQKKQKEILQRTA